MLMIGRDEEGFLLKMCVNEEETLQYPVPNRNFPILTEGNVRHESLVCIQKATLWVWHVFIFCALMSFLSSYPLRAIAEKTKYCCCRAYVMAEGQKTPHFAFCSVSTAATKPRAFFCLCWEVKKIQLMKLVFSSIFSYPSNEIILAAWQVPTCLFEFHSDQISWGRPLQRAA